MKSFFLRNIVSLYLIKISKWFNMVMPVIVLFYQDNGLNMQDIFTLKAIYSVAIVAMEIPSGYMADVWGRRNTLLLGGILASTGFALYSFSEGFWAFALAEIVLGAGHSFFSGADSAMLYDTLKASKREGEYVKQEGWVTSAGNFAEAFAGIVGGFLATISLHTPFYFQFAVAAIAVPAGWLLKEPLSRPSQSGSHLKKTIRIVVKTFTLPELRSAILLSSFTGTASLTFAWFVQPYFEQAGVKISAFGVMWTLLNLSVAFSSMSSYRFRDWLGEKNFLIFIISGLTAGYFAAAWEISLAGIAILFFFYIIRGIAHPVLKDFINQYTQSDVRATVLSLRDFAIRINFAIIGPLLGWLTDHYSLCVALMAAGAIYIVSMLFVIGPVWKILK
jgi:predicted MFS family arabinose efflux permease